MLLALYRELRDILMYSVDSLSFSFPAATDQRRNFALPPPSSDTAANMPSHEMLR